MNAPPLSAVLHYRREMAHKVAYQYMRRNFTIPFFICIGVPILVPLDYIVADTFSWGLWCFFLTFDLLFLLLMVRCYFGLQRRWLESLTRMGTPEVMITLTDENISFVSGAGNSTMPWRHFTHLWKYPEFWVLGIGKTTAFTLPLDGSTPAFLEFISQKVATLSLGSSQGQRVPSS